MGEPRRGARDVIDAVLDAGWSPLFEEIAGGDPLGFPGYPEQVARAREQTAASESVLVGEGTVDGEQPLVVIAFEFDFLGGSMGVAAGRRIVAAFDHAAAKKVPVLASTASGGARMQEGMLALAQMPATLAARARLAAAGAPLIAHLRDPTTGGVYASFASSADFVWADAGATIGFAGPRVAETVTGEPLPPGSHTAESAVRHGLADLALDGDGLGPAVRECLRILRGGDGSELPLASADPAIVPSLRSCGGRPVVAIVLGRGPGGDARPGPAGYRAARRAIRVATRLGLPVVTLVDTPGADPSPAAEAAGIAREISATFQAMLAAPVPTVAIVTGEGGSGGALALAACDRLLMRTGSTFSVIAPEGAAAILRRSDVDEVGRELKRTAGDLVDFGIADEVIDAWAPGTFPDEPVRAALARIAAEGGAPSARRLERFNASEP
ncbi:MAG TPA: carboxyl transferase domain-containing protein [Actinomycetota bacterium]